MPTICPASLPAAVAGAFYEQYLTFFMPAEVIDPASGVIATLNTLTVTSISGVPNGLDLELDEADAVYEPAAGQTLGCATLCGTPLVPGVYAITINVSVAVTALGFDQTVLETFIYTLTIEPGAGGTTTFAYNVSAGCESLLVDFTALVEPTAGQVAHYAWDFGNGLTSEESDPNGIFFDTSGSYTTTLTTTLGEYRLQAVILTGTNNGWSGDIDDFFSSPGDPYFVLTDGGGNAVYTSSSVSNTTSTSWSGLDIPLNLPPYTISFWDDDDLTADDALGTVAFTIEDNSALAINASGTTALLNISLEPILSAVDSAQIDVYEDPQPVVEVQGDSLYISDGPWPLTQWYLEGDSVEAPQGQATALWPTTSGWYQADITDTNGCWGLSEPTLFCRLHQILEANLVWDAENGTVEVAPGLGAFSWFSDGVLLPDENLHITDAIAGTVMTVEVFDHPDCPTLTGSINMGGVDLLGALDGNDANWNVHPVPFTDALWIDLGAAQNRHILPGSSIHAELLDMQGKRVATSPPLFSLQTAPDKPYHWVDIHVPTGVYLLHVLDAERSLGSRRIIRN